MENAEIRTRGRNPVDEQLIRNIDYDSLNFADRSKRSKLLLEVEILQRRQVKNHCPPSRVLVTVQEKPPVRTLYQAITDNANLDVKASQRSAETASDISDLKTRISSSSSRLSTSTGSSSTRGCHSCELCLKCNEKSRALKSKVLWSQTTLIPSHPDIPHAVKALQKKQQCWMNKATAKMKSFKNETTLGAEKRNTSKIDKATLIITHTSSEESILSQSVIDQLSKRIETLEQKVLRQEMAFRNYHNADAPRHDKRASGSHNTSYVQQYSQIPETSGFSRPRQQCQPGPSVNKRTINKEHNSEQYGRDFTTYDGITDTRQQRRRESASMPLNRCDAFEVNSMPRTRKHNAVRDYRLMDTVHYLAQGEFAPRNDGIKLTPSREAVLSDIIWEDVCRSHWPSARLTRQRPTNKHERTSHRSELQRQIDSMLRDKIAHIDKRRRRHYRVMKMNQDANSSRGVGKTGDVIVARNKNTSIGYNNNDPAASTERNMAGAETECRRILTKNEECHQDKYRAETSTAGPSPESQRKYRECALADDFIMSSEEIPSNLKHENVVETKRRLKRSPRVKHSSVSSEAESSRFRDHPRLVVSKKEPLPKKIHPSMEHYVLLPTLVVKTSSNFCRQKKFHDLYRALKERKQDASNNRPMEYSVREKSPSSSPTRKRTIKTKDNITETSDTSVNQ